MNRSRSTESGQAAVLLALAMIGLIAFAALAIDGGNAYLVRRNAQNAADGASISATRSLYRMQHPQPGDPEPLFPDVWLRRAINDMAQRNGVPDTNDNLEDITNDNIRAFYLDRDGQRLSELEVGTLGVLPGDAKGIEVSVDIPFDTFLASIIGRDSMQASADAGAVFTERSGFVQNAIYANATDCGQNTVAIGGSKQIIGGGIHSNDGVHLNGNASDPSVYTGTLEYADEVNIQNSIIINPPDNQATQAPIYVLPLLFDIELYAPGGQKAVEAGEDYYYLGSGKIQPSDLEDFDPPLLVGNNLRPGIYFAEDEIALGGGTINASGATFVTRGEFSASPSTGYFSPYEDETLFVFAMGGNSTCNGKAVTLSCASCVWSGLIYAPYGQVSFSASSNSTAYGSIVAYTVDLSGSYIEIHYDERYDPIVPPRVVLIW